MGMSGKIKMLLIACSLIVGLLIYIQFRLVNTTYRLTKVDYENEIRNAANLILNRQPAIEKLLENSLKFNFEKNVASSSSQQQFLDAVLQQRNLVLSHVRKKYADSVRYINLLNNAHYFAEFTLLSVEINGITHSLLHDANRVSKASPLRKDGLLLPVRTFQSVLNEKNVHLKFSRKQFNDVSIKFEGRQVINISAGLQEIWKRMAGTFILAAMLLTAEIVIFYSMFNAILRQKKLAEIQKDFADNITHELKTPLSSAMVIFKSLEKKEIRENSDKLTMLLQSLKRQHEKLQAITDAVLESSMVHKFQPEVTHCNITQHLRDYASDLKLAKHSLKAKIETNSNILAINVSLLDKALNNLIDNAVKYSPEGTTITLHAYSQYHSYFITITDTGIGISLKDQQRLFNKFYRAPESNVYTVKGLGLGLYISKLAVQQLNGSLSVNSKKGKGSTFIIQLPLI